MGKSICSKKFNKYRKYGVNSIKFRKNVTHRHQAKKFLKTIWNKGARKLLFGEEGRSTVNKYSWIVLGKEERKRMQEQEKEMRHIQQWYLEAEK